MTTCRKRKNGTSFSRWMALNWLKRPERHLTPLQTLYHCRTLSYYLSCCGGNRTFKKLNSGREIGAASVKLWWGSYGLLLLSNLGMRWNTVFPHSAEMLQSWAHRLPHTTLGDISTDAATQEVIMCCSIHGRLEVAVLHFHSPYLNKESVTKMAQSWYESGG